MTIEEAISALKTYQEMNETIKDLLRRIEEPMSLYILARIEELERQASRAPAWISVKDRLPVTGNVLATDGQIIITAPSSSVRNRKSITHWMPLPELPKEGADNDRTETR